MPPEPPGDSALRRVGSVTLQKTGLVPEEGGLRVKDAIDAFMRFTDKPMIASKDAVTTGLAQACMDGLIGLGRGAVPLESYSELFRCFVSPAARMNLKKLHLGIQFEMEVSEGQNLDPNDATLKAMKEAARQLGLTLETDEG